MSSCLQPRDPNEQDCEGGSHMIDGLKNRLVESLLGPNLALMACYFWVTPF